MFIDYVKQDYARQRKGLKPTKPVAKALLGMGYDKLGGKYEQR
jgi:hypothetical protein